MNNGIDTGIDTSESGVYLVESEGAYYIRAYNQGGYDRVDIPAAELKQWLNDNFKEDLV